MSEQFEFKQVQVKQVALKTTEKFLDTVVNSIIKKQRKIKQKSQDNEKYPQVYANIKEIFNEFDETIFECKKYNEAKIHRKYQIRIKDLQDQLKIVRTKIEHQQRARSPSKKYVQQLIDQLVKYKNQNQILNNKYGELQMKYNQIYQTSGSHYQLGDSKILSNTVVKSKEQYVILQSTENPQTLNLLETTVNQFLKIKHSQRKIRTSKKSSFEIFLKKSRSNLSYFTMMNFLQSIDQWSKQFQARLQISHSQRIKSNIMSTFEDELGQDKTQIKLPTLHQLDRLKKHPKIKQEVPGIYSTMQRKFKKEKTKQRSDRKYHSTIEVVQRKPKYKLM